MGLINEIHMAMFDDGIEIYSPWENGKRNIFREKRFIENSIKAKKSFIS